MRTAIVSDLHLGAAAGEDLLRDPALRRVLLDELAGADRLVLLGDVVELRDLALGVALEAARPFFEELGKALAGREVTIVPGNHDHRLAEPLLDRLSLGVPAMREQVRMDRPELGLAQEADPSPGPTAQIAAWLEPARLRIAYPGIWLREDVYATHGHYMDAHLTLPRAECVMAAALARLSGPLPNPATPADYERVLRPLYGFGFGVAQARSRPGRRRRRNPSEAVWKLLTRNGGGTPRQRLAAASARHAFPLAIGALNRLLDADFTPDVSAAAIFRGGLAGAAEMAARLGVDGARVITGHTHRGGPQEGEDSWPLAGGGNLHNTGSWIFASAFHHPGTPPSPYWPGTVTWLEESGPPRQVRLLLDRPHAELLAVVRRNRESMRA